MEEAARPPWQFQLEIICVNMALICVIVQPICMTGIAVQFPHTELFWTSFLEDPYANWVLLVSVPSNHLLICYVWSGLLLIFVFIVTFAYVTTAVILELRSGGCFNSLNSNVTSILNEVISIRAFTGRTEFTKQEMRKPGEVVLIYRSFQVLLHDFNAIARSFLQTFLNNGCPILVVVLAFAGIKFYRALVAAQLCILVVGTIGTSTFLILSYLKLGGINDKSKKVLGTWKRWQGGQDRKLMLMYIRASAELKVELNSFGFYQKQNTIRIVGKLIYYTGKLLVMAKKMN